jgi:5-aminopentanamidase
VKPCVVPTDRIASVLSPLASDSVATIVGFSELSPEGNLYNSAAILCGGAIAGLYRKNHPAIRRSVYQAGTEAPVFQVGEFIFGVVICYDSNFPALATRMAAQGARAIFVPTNNGLPRTTSAADVAAAARACDVARAAENGIWVIRADVAGAIGDLVSAGSSRVVRPDGSIMLEAREFSEELLVVDIEPAAG